MVKSRNVLEFTFLLGGESVGFPIFSPANTWISRTCTTRPSLLSFNPSPSNSHSFQKLPLSEFFCFPLPFFLSVRRREGQWKPLLLPSAFSTIIGALRLHFLLRLRGLATRISFLSTLSSWCPKILPTVG